MKKTLLSLTFIAMAFGAMSQGTWFATGTEALIPPSTDIDLGIANLKCQHSDAAAAGVIGKSDVGAPSVSYNGVEYKNETQIQGATNGMYYAFIPSQAGTLDISIKMGSGKKTYVIKVKDETYTYYETSIGNLSVLTNKVGILTGFVPDDLDAYPQVYDTYNKTTGIWDGSTAIQSSGSNQYLVMSFPVAANKTYCVGCAGSKLMLRGVSYFVGSAAIDQNKASSYKVIANAGRISINNITNEKISVSDLMGRSIQVNDPSDIAVNPGMYFVKVNNEVTKIMVK